MIKHEIIEHDVGIYVVFSTSESHNVITQISDDMLKSKGSNYLGDILNIHTQVLNKQVKPSI